MDRNIVDDLDQMLKMLTDEEQQELRNKVHEMEELVRSHLSNLLVASEVLSDRPEHMLAILLPLVVTASYVSMPKYIVDELVEEGHYQAQQKDVYRRINDE